MMNELREIGLASLPIIEYRGAIPVGILTYHFVPLKACLLALVGSALPFFPLYFGLAKFRELLEKFAPRLLAPFDRTLEHARRKFEKNYRRFGAAAVFVLVALPIPILGGVWTATLGAVAFQLPFRSTLIGVLFGLLVGTLAVTIASVGIQALV